MSVTLASEFENNVAVPSARLISEIWNVVPGEVDNVPVPLKYPTAPDAGGAPEFLSFLHDTNADQVKKTAEAILKIFIFGVFDLRSYTAKIYAIDGEARLISQT